MDHRTAELLLELHASQHQASQPQALQPRHPHPTSNGMGSVPGGYLGDREMPSVEYTIESQHHPVPTLRQGGRPHADVKNKPQASIAHAAARSTIQNTGGNLPHEERTKLLNWAEDTFNKGRPSHPTIRKLMEPLMQRAVSEPVALPSAIKRITRLPMYIQKDSSSGDNAVGEKAGEASSAGANLKGDGSSTAIAKARSSLSGQTAIQQGGRKNKGAKRLLARLADMDKASALDVPLSSRTQKTSSTTASSSSKPVVERRHHCIRDGHRFKLLPLKRVGVAGGGGRTENKIGARKYKCGKCKGRIDERKILMCGVEVCGMMICAACKRDWEIMGERRLRESWKRQA